jgi:sugar phosphate permease
VSVIVIGIHSVNRENFAFFVVMNMKNTKNVVLYGNPLRLLWFVLCSYVPTIFILTTATMWIAMYLVEKRYAMYILNRQLFSWNICLSVGVLAAGWCSDKIFRGSRWITTIFFQAGLTILLLFFWLSHGNFTAAIYPYFMAGVFAITSGAIVSIFLTAIEELVNKKILGITISAIIIFMYYVHAGSIAISGLMIDILGWNGYFATLVFIGILATSILWFYRPVPGTKS